VASPPAGFSASLHQPAPSTRTHASPKMRSSAAARTGAAAVALLSLLRLPSSRGAGPQVTSCAALASSPEDAASCEEAIDNDVHDVQLVQANTVHEMSASVLAGSASKTAAAGEISASGGGYGSADCPCIGVERVGAFVVKLTSGNSTFKTSYPASVGSSCSAWDRGRHPECKGTSPPSWCTQQWCFVDGCNCKLTTPPKISSYMPNATFQGHQLYYSYATCGGTDTWTASKHKDSCVNQANETLCNGMAKCSWTAGKGCLGKELALGCSHIPSDNVTGNDKCKCIGISNITGHAKASINGLKYPFPAEVGSYCKAWDSNFHPDCAGSVDPYWCSQKWCYIDPCSCQLDAVPKMLTYFPKATYQGRPLFYSFRTCGEHDSYSQSQNTQACPNQMSEYQCSQVSDCTWAGGTHGCVSSAIINTCGWQALGSAASLRLPALALLAAAAAGLLPSRG